MKIHRLKSLEILRSMLLFYELRRNVHRDISSLKAKQLNKLKKLLLHAYKNTDYYRKLFDEYKFDPYNIKSISDLRKLPILDKGDIQKNYDGILSRTNNNQKILSHQTSGSTGLPLTFYSDPNSRIYNRVLTYRAYVENGLSFRDVLVQITDPEYQDIPILWFQKLGLFRRYRLSILKPCSELFTQINSIKPDIIQGYPSVLNLIAQKFSKEQLKFKPKLIFTTAELLLPTWRSNISRFFDSDVIDLYGSSEFHRMAWECEKHEGYHLDIDAHVIEFLDRQNNPVEEGDGFIVVTGLFNYVFPLVRYKIGDIAQLKKDRCKCGRSLPLITSIQGREDDYIKLPSGKMVSPRKIDFQDNIKGVKEYIAIQPKRDLIKIQIVKDDGFTKETINSIKKQILRGCLEEEINVEVEIVQEIKRIGGKLRTVVSMVK